MGGGEGEDNERYSKDVVKVWALSGVRAVDVLKYSHVSNLNTNLNC